MSFLQSLTDWLQAYGGPGLFLAAALDSFVPLAHIVDPTVVYLSYANGDPVSYALLATAGSVLGSSVLFLLVRAGGDKFVARKMTAERREQLASALERYGLLSIVVGGIMPPPFPLKGLVLVAGLARMRLATFAGGLLIARLFRYGLESTLAVFYGEQAMTMMKEHYPIVGLVAIALTVSTWLIARRMLRVESIPAAD